MIAPRRQPYLNTRETTCFSSSVCLPSWVERGEERWPFLPLEHGDAAGDGIALPRAPTRTKRSTSWKGPSHFSATRRGISLVRAPKYGPREIPHGFRVTGTTLARMLLLGAPAGFEHRLETCACHSLRAPAPPDMTLLIATAASAIASTSWARCPKRRRDDQCADAPSLRAYFGPKLGLTAPARARVIMTSHD